MEFGNLNNRDGNFYGSLFRSVRSSDLPISVAEMLEDIFNALLLQTGQGVRFVDLLNQPRPILSVFLG